MKHIKLGILFFMFVETVFAQTKRDSIYKNNNTTCLEVSGGAVLPTGDFANNTLGNSWAGFAKKGFNAGLSLTQVLYKGTGFAAMYRFQDHKFDETSFINQTTSKYPGISWDLSTTPWKVNAFMLGYYGSYLIEKKRKVFIDIRFLLGMVKAASPEINLTGSQGNFSASVDQSTSSANAFAYCAGLGFKFDVDPSFFFIIRADYLQTNLEFKNISITTSPSSSSSLSPVAAQNFTQNISSINISAGIAFKID